MGFDLSSDTDSVRVARRARRASLSNTPDQALKYGYMDIAIKRRNA